MSKFFGGAGARPIAEKRAPAQLTPMRLVSISFTLTALLALSTLPTLATASGPPEEADLPAVDDAQAEVEEPKSPEPDDDEAEADESVADEADETDDPEPEASEEPKPEPKPKKKSSSRAKKTKKSSKSATRSKRPRNSPECAYRTPLYHHKVQEGEHLGLIAGRYGVLRKDLITLNPGLKNPDLIRPGDEIKVCPEIAPRESTQVTYVVKAGDNLHAIAKAYGLTSKELLAQQNPALDNPDRILAGQELTIVTQGKIVAGFEPEVHRKYDKGRLKTSHRLPKGLGYKIKRPYLAYGTASTIKLIAQAIDTYHRRANGGPAIRVGDISKEGGGPLKGHVSHQRGVDVDIGLVHKGAKKNELRFFAANKGNLDVRRTWLLVHAFLKTEQVRYIFLDYRLQKLLYDYAKKSGVSESKLDEYFQYPRGIGRNHGIIRHWKGHRDHIHVRFRR